MNTKKFTFIISVFLITTQGSDITISILQINRLGLRNTNFDKTSRDLVRHKYCRDILINLWTEWWRMRSRGKRRRVPKKQSINLKRYMDLSVHCSTIYNSQDMEATYVSTERNG